MPPNAPIAGDALRYVTMTEGGPSSTIAPFRYRVVVPFLARLLPLPPPRALLVITVVSLLAFYVVTMRTSIALGASAPFAFVGLAALFFAFWHQYNFHNPYLTDGFQLAMLALMLHGLATDRFAEFTVASMFAVGARETSIVLVPAWLLLKGPTKVGHYETWRGLAAIAIGVGVLAIPRIVYADGTPLLEALGKAYRAAGGDERFPWVFAQRVYDAYGYFWPLILAAVAVNHRRAVIVVPFVLLFAGALIASIIAVDTGRMFQLLMPVSSIAAALGLQKLRR